MKDAIKFILVFKLCILQVLLVIGALNWFVDPYSVRRPPPENPRQPIWMSKQLRMAKALYVNELNPKGIIIGASTAQLALDPSHPGWPNEIKSRYNLALPGANMYENLRYYQHARANAPLQQVILGLDFVAFNQFSPLSHDFKEWLIATDRKGNAKQSFVLKTAVRLFSLDALTASQKKIFTKRKATHWANGREIPEETGKRHWHEAMLGSASGFVTRLLLPPPSHRFCIEDATGNDTAFDQLETLLRTAANDGTDIRLFIQPSHAFLLESLRISGYWNDYENWERKLVSLVAKINKETKPGKKIVLWDFSGYNAFTSEALAVDSATAMKWYWDSGHYKKDLGDRVQDRIFGFKHPDRIGLENFGATIDANTIESHLKTMEEKRKIYLETNNKDIEELESRVKNALKNIPPYDCQSSTPLKSRL